jgi:GntR family transcriptional regulator, transcriptional repressor for pyruvate dehydrogenase complex
MHPEQFESASGPRANHEMGAREDGGTLRVSPRPLSGAKIASTIADDLRSLIVRTGRAGDFLPPERTLIERYDVSRPTVREAIRMLEAEGLITVRRGARGGAVVNQTSIDAMSRTFGVYLQQRHVRLKDVFDARLIIEPNAARLAALCVPPDVSVLEAVLEREAASTDDLHNELARTEVEFHQALLNASGNVTLAGFGHLLTEIITRHDVNSVAILQQTTVAHRRRLAREVHRAHIRLLETVRAGDADEAERVMRSHLNEYLKAMPIDPDERADVVGPAADAI